MALSLRVLAARDGSSLVPRVTRTTTLPGRERPVRPRRWIERISDGTGS